MSNTATALPGQETLLASWIALARISPGARLVPLGRGYRGRVSLVGAAQQCDPADCS